MSYMKRLKEMLDNGELPVRHLLEPGGAIGFHGKGYPTTSKFNGVDITIKNNKTYPIEIRLTETGFHVELVRKN